MEMKVSLFYIIGIYTIHCVMITPYAQFIYFRLYLFINPYYIFRYNRSHINYHLHDNYIKLGIELMCK
jgi:hypothetical protein